jgi:two-component system C4-dicarboxylate transport response regulator DctD
LVQINCASLPEETYHVDLFGAAPMARTAGHGASRRTVGRLERAHRGVVLLDDVDALSLSQQAKLLSFVENREIWALGAEEPQPIDVLIIATTKVDLKQAVAAGRFRADLFYRLSGVSLHIPALTQRRSDIRLLFQNFVVRAAARLNRPIPRLTELVLAHLETYDWPGNVRELEQFADRYTLGLEDARLPSAAADDADQGLNDRVARFEADMIRETLALYKGDAQASAKALRLPRKTFYYKLARHAINIGAYR